PPYNDEFCPERNITRGEMAAFLARALQLSAMTGVPAYDDVGGHLFEVAVDKIQTAGIAFGCDADSYCPDQPLNRYEMAELLVRAFGYENPDGIDFFTDDNGNQFEESINKLAAAGITVGCNPPANDHYCPDRQLTRAEMATFFVRALGL
ncbi:MAG: S-layer homology domain-containing protein, partial [Acidimicrobiia bacterium]